jgi:hypothetical protein
VKAASGGQGLFPIHRSWTIATIVVTVMVLLALLGVGLTTTSSSFAVTYWVSLVPIYGLLCIGTAWIRATEERQLSWPVVVRQALHWLSIGVALGLDFFIRGTGEETGVAAGLNALLVLALGCFLAGIHLEWPFALVGVLLTAALIIVAKADQYLWLIFLIAGVTIAVMIALRWLIPKPLRKHKEAAAPASVPAGS